MIPAGIHPQSRVGGIRLRVADLDRAVAFYRETLGVEVDAGAGDAHVVSGAYHYDVALSTRQGGGRDGYLTILLPDRKALAAAVGRLLGSRYPVDGARDFGATVAVYLRDPDGNAIELSYDRPTGGRAGAGEQFDPLELVIGWSIPVPALPAEAA